MKKIVLCGGGTAGHIIPNIALLPYLKEVFGEVHYIASVGGMEKNLLKGHDVIYHEIACVKLIRKLTPKNLGIPCRLLKSIGLAKKLLRDIKPDIIFSKGGFAALPVVWAARGIPVIAHESDLSMGLANRLVKNKCAKICTTFEGFSHIKNAVFCGSPIRQEIYNGDKNRILHECGFSGFKPVLCVMGGSLGASALNNALLGALDELTFDYDIIHLTGKGKLNHINKNGYKGFEFRRDMADVLAASDLVVTRGGSNALCELMCLKKPCLIVPLKKQSRGDQVENARYFGERGMALVLDEDLMNEKSMAKAIHELYSRRREIVSNIKKHPQIDGTAKIMGVIKDVAKI